MWGRAEVAYQAHNLMVVGSNPTPATNMNIVEILKGLWDCFLRLMLIPIIMAAILALLVIWNPIAALVIFIIGATIFFYISGL